MNKVQYKKAWNTAKAVDWIRAEGDSAMENGDYREYERAQEAVSQGEWGLMVQCQGDIDVMHHLEDAVRQRETQRRKSTPLY